MGNRNRELRAAVEAELAKHMATGVSWDHGGKHDFMTFAIQGVKMRLTITTTPSDHRYINNTIRDLKRRIRERLDSDRKTG